MTAASQPASASSRIDLPRLAVWLVAIGVLCAWFLTLDARHLLRSDEGRYAEIAREMLASGDWVTIRYNGLKYFEKPPWHLWMTALAYRAFGIGEWQARLWVAVCGLGGAALTMLAASRWFGARVGVLAGLVLIAAPAWNIAAHFNSLDMSVSAALACALAGFLIALHPSASPSAERGWMWFAWAAIGVAILSKGLIGIVLPGLVLIAYSIVARDWAVWRRLRLASGAALMLVIVVPWFVLVSMRNPEFARFFFVHEHWQRYTSTIHERAAPVWYFVPYLLAGFLPWLGLFPRMLQAVRDERRAGGASVASGRSATSGFRPKLFLAVWALAIFLFFSLSSSKLPGYIVPIFPALAVLAALALEAIDDRSWLRQIRAMTVVWLLVLCAAPFYARQGSAETPHALYAAFAVWLAAAATLALLGLAVAWRLRNSQPRLRSITAYALAVFGAVTVGLVGHDVFGRASSGFDLAARVRSLATPDTPIYSVRLLDHTLPFYLGRTPVLVERPDELAFGVAQEPQKWLPTLDAFLGEWRLPRHALALMSHATYAELQHQNVAMFPVAEDARRIVVANFDPGSAARTR